MDRRDLDRLVEDICNAKYEYYSSYDHKLSKSEIVGDYGSDCAAKKQAIEKAVYHWGEDMIDYKSAELGEYKAKCYSYEQMIANSNFAPILQQKIDPELIKERGKMIALLSVQSMLYDLEDKYRQQYGSEIIEMYSDIVSDLRQWLSNCVNQSENVDTNP